MNEKVNTEPARKLKNHGRSSENEDEKFSKESSFFTDGEKRARMADIDVQHRDSFLCVSVYVWDGYLSVTEVPSRHRMCPTSAIRTNCTEKGQEADRYSPTTTEQSIGMNSDG
ncbi:hypothetical protein V1478_008698 [Vespula squamosa]